MHTHMMLSAVSNSQLALTLAEPPNRTFLAQLVQQDQEPQTPSLPKLIKCSGIIDMKQERSYIVNRHSPNLLP
jgi:hypothetical protein